MVKRCKQKEICRIIVITTAFLLALNFIPQVTYAQNATAYTYTVSEDGKWVRTQDAYLSGAILFRDFGLKKPEDIFIKEGKIYIADTGNSRIVIMDIKTGDITLIGENILDSPTGVFVDENKRIFVADAGLDMVVLFSPNGELIRSYERPDSPIFGSNTNFKPRKVVSDKRGNIYIVSEGSYDGIIQLSKQGEFLGYFCANLTALTPLEVFQDIFFTEQQKIKLFNRIPKTFYNIAIDTKGMIYTITQGVKGDAIKKHNVSGVNILNESGDMVDEENFVDLAIGGFGQIYAVTETGLVYEYDSAGNLVFSFGGRAISTERNGLFTVASGIAVDEENHVYVLDKERGIVQIFYPTAFARMVHEAMYLFDNGKYNESMELWAQILELSGKSRIAHNGLANAYMQKGDFVNAAKHYRIAQNRNGYSEAYWEIRNQWLQQNTGSIMIAIFILIILNKLMRILMRKYDVFHSVKTSMRRLKDNRLFGDIIYLKNILRHPFDSFYYIRKDEKATVASATVIYAIGLIVFAVDYLFRGFIFNYRNAREISYLYVMALFLLPCGLWVVGNYMVSSINNGEGRLKDVYCATAYSLAPLILFMPFVTALSHFLTLNEAFIIEFSTLIIWTWCSVNIFIGLKEIHDFEIRDVVKNILLTLFFIFICVIAYSIVMMLWDQLIEFMNTVVKEVLYRVHQ